MTEAEKQKNGRFEFGHYDKEIYDAVANRFEGYDDSIAVNDNKDVSINRHHITVLKKNNCIFLNCDFCSFLIQKV